MSDADCPDCSFPFANVISHDCEKHRAFVGRLRHRMTKDKAILDRLKNEGPSPNDGPEAPRD